MDNHAQKKIMKKKTLEPSKRHANTETPQASPHWRSGAFEKNGDRQTDHAVRTASSHRKDDDEVFQEQIPLIQITLSVSQIEQSLKVKGEPVGEEIQEPVSNNTSDLIGIGRNHRSQWTMMTAPMIGIAKKRGNVKMNF